MSLRQRLGLDLPPLGEGRAGDPGLFGPGSEVWRVGRERVLLLGGPAALLMQLAHPLVAAAVAEHSDFLADPFLRLRATLDATLRVSFGDTEQSRDAAAGVRGIHRPVRGTIPAAVGPFPAGAAYRASDPELALWVHATLVSVALDSYELFVGAIPRAHRERYYDEATRFARLFGVTDEVLPPSYRSFLEYLRAVEEGNVLSVGDQARILASQVLEPPLPVLLRLGGPASRAVTASLLPVRLRDGFGLPWGPKERALVRSLSVSVRATLRALPPNIRYWGHYRVACRRVHIPGERG